MSLSMCLRGKYVCTKWSSASASTCTEFLSLDRGVIIGESCMGPTTGTFANPVLRRLPIRPSSFCRNWCVCYG